MHADNICVRYPYKHDIAIKEYMERDAVLNFKFERLNKLIMN